MIFKSGWSRKDIEDLTYKELFEYVEIYYRMHTETLFEFFKAFSAYNCESTSVAVHGKKRDLDKYLKQVNRRRLSLQMESSNLKDQFTETDFG